MRAGRWAAAVVLGGLVGCADDAGTTGDAAVDRSTVDAGAVDAADVNDLGWATDATTDTGVPRCVPGMSVACACAGGTSGVQVCSGAGVYGACQCLADSGTVLDVPVDAPRPMAITGPRLITPRSVSRAMTQRPTFRWVPPAGVTRARVTLARDRALTTGVQTAEATGTSWRPTVGLPFAVWFWRVEGIGEDGGVVWTSPTWEFRTPRRDSEVDSSWGTFRDFNGDGYDDLAVGAIDLRIYQGSATGLTATPTEIVHLPDQILPGYLGRWLFSEPTTGDLNGDGLTDLAYILSSDTVDVRDGGVARIAYRLHVHYGAPSGLRADPDVVLSDYGDSRGYSYYIPYIFDANGDGHGDLLVTLLCYDFEGCMAEDDDGELDGGGRSAMGSRVAIYAGGPSPVASERRLPAEEYWRYSWLKPLGDLDRDGFEDLTYKPIDRDREVVLRGFRPPLHVAWPLANEVVLTQQSADVDGDGNLEMITATFDQVHVFRTLGLPEMPPAPWVVIGAPETPTGLSATEGFGASFRAGDVKQGVISFFPPLASASTSAEVHRIAGAG